MNDEKEKIPAFGIKVEAEQPEPITETISAVALLFYYRGASLVNRWMILE